ncbi:MAG: hypothetical protein ACE361_02550 [Aureliella sp.]
MTERSSSEPQKHIDIPYAMQGSLCLKCGRRRIIQSGKGSVFMMCTVGISDSGWPKYPPQPVSRCPKFNDDVQADDIERDD